MLVDLRLVQGPELGLVLGDDGHLDLGGLEVGGEDGGEAVDRHLNSLVMAVLSLLLEVLLQEGIRLGLLGSDGAGLETNMRRNRNKIQLKSHLEGGIISSGVGLVDTGSILLIVGYEYHGATEGPHLGVLGVDLGDVAHPLAEHVHGDLVAVLVLPVGSLVPGSLHSGPAVRSHPSHHAADTSREQQSFSSKL